MGERIRGSYYSICDTGVLENLDDEGGRDDEVLYTCGNYFADEQLANDQARAISLWLRIKRWVAEHCEPVDWGNGDTHKRMIWYNCSTGIFSVGMYNSEKVAFGVYFDSLEHAKQCIEEFRDDLLWYFTECRDRMDG